MANNGKRPREEPGRNFTNFRTYGPPIRRHRLPSSDEPSDYEYEDGSSSAEEDGWTTTDESEPESGVSGSSMDTDFYDEEEEMMLLDELYGEETEEEEEEEDEEGMDLIEFSSGEEDSEFEEAMDREQARVEMEMYRKEQRKKLIPPEMIPDGIDSDDEEAWQFLEDEWICEQEQRILYEQHQQQNTEKSKSIAQEPESVESGSGPDWDALDAINRRFLIRGNVSGKPCTMTSSVGPRRARISMVGMIVPATEMLRNFFRDSGRRGDAGVKENSGRVPVTKVAPRMVARGNGATCQRKALSERNL